MTYKMLFSVIAATSCGASVGAFLLSFALADDGHTYLSAASGGVSAFFIACAFMGFGVLADPGPYRPPIQSRRGPVATPQAKKPEPPSKLTWN